MDRLLDHGRGVPVEDRVHLDRQAARRPRGPLEDRLEELRPADGDLLGDPPADIGLGQARVGARTAPGPAGARAPAPSGAPRAPATGSRWRRWRRWRSRTRARRPRTSRSRARSAGSSRPGAAGSAGSARWPRGVATIGLRAHHASPRPVDGRLLERGARDHQVPLATLVAVELLAGHVDGRHLGHLRRRHLPPGVGVAARRARPSRSGRRCRSSPCRRGRPAARRGARRGS